MRASPLSPSAYLLSLLGKGSQLAILSLGHVQARCDVAWLLAQPVHGSEGHGQVDTATYRLRALSNECHVSRAGRRPASGAIKNLTAYEPQCNPVWKLSWEIMHVETTGGVEAQPLASRTCSMESIARRSLSR